MNKKTIILLTIILVAAVLVFLVINRTERQKSIDDILEQPLEKALLVLEEELRLLDEKIRLGEINQETAGQELDLLEEKTTELIASHDLQTKVDELLARKQTIEELRPVMRNIESYLFAITEAGLEHQKALKEELLVVAEKASLGKISQKEAADRLSFLEDKITELISQHNIRTEVDELVISYKKTEELIEQVEPRIQLIETQLWLTLDYFIQKYSAEDTRTEQIEQAIEDLDEQLWELTEEIWAGEVDKEEISQRLSFLEDKIKELITQHNIKEQINQLMVNTKAARELRRAVDQRFEDILLQLQAIKIYLLETETNQ